MKRLHFLIITVLLLLFMPLFAFAKQGLYNVLIKGGNPTSVTYFMKMCFEAPNEKMPTKAFQPINGIPSNLPSSLQRFAKEAEENIDSSQCQRVQGYYSSLRIPFTKREYDTFFLAALTTAERVYYTVEGYCIWNSAIEASSISETHVVDAADVPVCMQNFANDLKTQAPQGCPRVYVVFGKNEL